MEFMKSWAPALAGAATLALVACAGGPPPPTVVELTLVAAGDVNFHSGVPHPIVVNVYQLESPDSLTNAPFSTIGDLSGMLGDPHSLIVDSSKTVVHELAPESRFIGIVAEFFLIDTAVWKATVPIPANETTVLTANIGASSVALQ